MIGKANNFLLEISGTSGAIRFGVHIGGSWVYLTAPAGTIKANGRGFAIGVYDGTNMYLYVANPNVVNQLLTYSQGQTGSLDSSSADLYIGGASFNGVVAEVMIWTRALSAQEVQELFFRPLTRIIAKGTTATLTGNAQPGDVIQGQTFYNTDPTNKLTGTLSWAFTKGLRVQQKLTLLLQQITTKIKDHVCQMTRTLVLKILTTGANDHTCTMTRTKSLTLYVTKWFVDIDSQQAALGSTDHEGLNVVNSGSTLTFTATPNLANNYILKMTNTFMFDTTLVTATSIQTVSPYAGTYTIPAQTVGTVHELKPIWLKGFIVIGGSNTTINGYNSVVSGNSISWSAVGSAGTGNHWEYYWNGIDVGRSSGSQTAADGTVNSATCAILTGT